MQFQNSDGKNSWAGLIDLMRQIEDSTSLSLPQYIKRAVINSRAFIQRECADAEILPDVMTAVMNMYVGFVMTTANMNRYVDKTNTVRDIMSTVATEAFTGQQSLERNSIPSSIEDKLAYLNGSFKPAKMEFDSLEPTKSHTSTTSGSKIHEVPSDVNLPSGRIIEIGFGKPDQKGNSQKSTVATVTMFLQISPTFITSAVASAFIGCNFSPSIKQRYLQMNTGEISFWKDFVLGNDMRKNRRKALRQDKDGALKEMFDKQQSSISDAWLKMILFYAEKQNIANSILVFDSYTFQKACNDNGLKFDNYASRQRFFDKTFAMMVLVINQMDNKVSMYFNGWETRAEYTFAQMRVAAKNSKYDLGDIMKAYGQGMAPKY